MNPIINAGWSITNKLMGIPFYLAGLGAARDMSRGYDEAFKGALQLPYDLSMGIANNEGLLSLGKGSAKLLFGVGQSMISNPLETAVAAGVGFAIGKALAWKSERERQYRRDLPRFKEEYKIN